MNDKTEYVPFSQRNGFKEAPPQLQLGEVSEELRRLVNYYIHLEIDRETGYTHGRYFLASWRRVTSDIHVVFLGSDVSSYDSDVSKWVRRIESLIKQSTIEQLFDFIEFVYRHPKCSSELRLELGQAFVQCRAAYRFIDNQLVAIGSDQQATVFLDAIGRAEAAGELAARQHLVSAGKELAQGNWAGSVRESIHAVEAMVVKLAPEKNTLGAALSMLEKEGHVHGGLKNAFSALYGWSSDEEGVRHALVFKNAASVDETDALFMLGACSSFVSYLVSRNQGR